jgi:hypothetical protein
MDLLTKLPSFRDEFIQKYLETRARLTDKLNDTYKKISDHKRQRDEMAEKLR